jgi:aminoglycoside phosphotransferase (APT) family kinase protein
VPGVVSRDLTGVHRAFVDWFASRLSSTGVVATDLEIALTHHTGGGYSNEIILVDVTYRAGQQADEHHHERLVLRRPPAGPSLVPAYDLAMQVAVQAAVGEHGVPVPTPVILEPDDRWLGSAVLVMPLVEGQDLGDLPAADPWLGAATAEEQRRLHDGFLDTLARVHQTPWQGRPVATRLRGAGAPLLDEVRWWQKLIVWAFDGAPPAALADAFTWCAERCPAEVPPSSLLWGDVRLGNVIFDDAFAPVAVLDWEMASIGPAELDVAWFTALEAMTEHFFGQRVAGFPTRDDNVARHERALGRSLVEFTWFEAFAMCRSTALNLRTDRLASLRLGKPPRPVEDNAVLAYTLDRIASIS